MKITVYHNPRCSKSRQTLALIRERGHEPSVVEYLKTPPGPDLLQRITALLGVGAHDLIRSGETEYRELGLSPQTPETELIAAMVEHPRLIERPIVTTDEAARLGRPPEAVLEILP